MGRIKKDLDLVCFFCAVMYSSENELDRLRHDLIERWGGIAFESDFYDFSAGSSYYEKEMGDSLKKKIFVFENLMELEGLHKTKVVSNHLEELYAEKNGCRKVNVDPGYITEAKLLLFTTKDFFHRIYVKDSIYCEVTLYYKAKKGFVPFDWSYPDYSMKENLIFFNKVRMWYRELLGRKRNKNL